MAPMALHSDTQCTGYHRQPRTAGGIDLWAGQWPTGSPRLVLLMSEAPVWVIGDRWKSAGSHWQFQETTLIRERGETSGGSYADC